jgi:hypothetical protein
LAKIQSVKEQVTSGYLGYIELLSGNKKEAQRLLNDSLDAALEYLGQSSLLFGVDSEGWALLDGKARLELEDGRTERAARLFGAAWDKTEGIITEAERPDYEACIAEIRSALGDAAFEETFHKGQAMNIKEALEFALAE